MRRLASLALFVIAAALPLRAGDGKIIVFNEDNAGLGFNDPTPVEPVGGNEGRTLGEQRMNVFLAAAQRWNALLDIDVDIHVVARFAPIAPCTATSGVLGQAGPMSWQRDFKNAPLANVWYPIALANQLAGHDLAPFSGEIFVQFNGAVDNETCLGASNWYYGFDRQSGIHSDLYVVVLHELAHGLGVAGAASAPGFRDGHPSIFDVNTVDSTVGTRWDQMSIEQRRVSMTNTGKLVWNGEAVRSMAGRYAQPVTVFSVSAPESVARDYEVGLAAFGPAANRGTSGSVVRATDAADADGATTFDGCSAFTNAAEVSGSLAVVDRGTCTFVTKARNAQAAGARGLIVVDHTRDRCVPPPMGGVADDVTIPVVSITAADGDVLGAHLTANATVRGSFRSDATQLAGTSKEGQLRLYAPCTNEPGSSVHHWDVMATPNLLMEPSINSDLLHGVDLTLYQLLDLGWKARPRTGRTVLQR